MINVGDATEIVKAKIAAALALDGVDAPTSWSDATNKLNGRALVYGLPVIEDRLAGGVARARINAVIAALETPHNISLPLVTGDAVEGETLTASTGEWAGLEPIEYAYQWFNTDGDIAGAADETYVLQESDVGLEVGVRVTGTNVRGSRGAESELSTTIAGAGWWRSGSLFDADFENTRYRFAGENFTDKAAWLTAIGGGETSGVITIGPYVAPDAPELVTNGHFTADLAGWTPVLNGTSTATIVSNAARLTGDNTTGTGGGGAGIIQALATEVGKAYRVNLIVSSLTLTARVGSTLYGTECFSGSFPAGSHSFVFFAQSPTSYLYLFRLSGGSTVDDVSVQEALPVCEGFDASGFTIDIDATSPPSHTNIRSLAALDVGTALNSVRFHYLTNGNFIVQTRNNSATVGGLATGALAPNTDFNIRTSQKTDDFRALRTDGQIISDTAGELPKVYILRIGSDDAGNTWGGTVKRFTLTTGGGFDQFIEPLALIHAEGDSGTFGHNTNIGLGPSLVARSGRPVYVTAVNGSTAAQQSARMSTESTAVKAKVAVWFDLSPNGWNDNGGTVDTYCDTILAGFVGYNRRLYIPPIPEYLQAGQSLELSIRDGMMTRLGSNVVIDWRNFLALDENGFPTADMYNDPGIDNTHLSLTASNALADAVIAKISSNGW